MPPFLRWYPTPDAACPCPLYQLQLIPTSLGLPTFNLALLVPKLVHRGVQQAPTPTSQGPLQVWTASEGPLLCSPVAGNTAEPPRTTVNCTGRPGTAQLSPGLSQGQWTLLASPNGSPTGPRRGAQREREQWRPPESLRWVSRALHFLFCPGEKRTFLRHEEQGLSTEWRSSQDPAEVTVISRSLGSPS